MSIYGHAFDNYRSDILYEFNFKDTIENIKKAIKRAILNLLDKVERFLDKCKDNKLKSWCKGLIQKIRKLLVKCNDIETETDAKKLSSELNEYNSEFNDKIKLEFKHTDVHLDQDDLDKIRDYLDKEIDFSSYIQIVKDRKDIDSTYSGYDLKEMYDKVYKKAYYSFTSIHTSLESILTDKLFDLPLYKNGVPEIGKYGLSGNTFVNSIYGQLNKDDKLNHAYVMKMRSKFKPLKYNGQITEKYFEDAKEFIIKTVLEYAKNYESRFNKVVRDIEIRTFNKEKEFYDKLNSLNKEK